MESPNCLFRKLSSKGQKFGFTVLLGLQSKRRSKYGECSSMKEIPPCFLKLRGFLHFPLQFLFQETCGKEFCFQVSSPCGQLAEKVE